MTNKLVLNIGINDADYVTVKEEKINGKRKVVWRCPYYVRWYNLISRCYSTATLQKNPTYIGCTVCEEWLTFSNFKAWMETQDWENKQLDKDLKILGNMVYSPETCLFISFELNKFLNENQNNRGDYPIGVYLKSENRYGSQCGKTHLGYYDTAFDAHQRWLSEKINRIDKFIEVSENEIKHALIKFKSILQYHVENGIIFKGIKYEIH
ncbi:HNH endonuclease [Cronobacter phage vB_CsaM_GAP32]|uniref:DNA binding protein n=1 Tax=Cronobacter phage vB_CsaM_GAP32 TaxID=1141136 RepID=K4F9N1_9CAUD|nr:HNH endonuclease [Cronobacter phage vB_CsaM_GAP32]AFC21805.1 hypothetical protein GAP32_355 [Cronobacter phage vB_CsaM_GAP32]